MNKEDRELLELAALASNKEYGWQHIFDDYEGSTSEKWDWNPLEDDGDAFRLAVQLNFDLWNSDGYRYIAAGVVPADNMFNAKLASEKKKKDPYKATRKAIVRAAAEIGRLMK